MMSRLNLRIAACVALMACALTPALALAQQAERTAAAARQEVTIFLVALGDKGRAGRRIGCDDSLVPVRRQVAATGAPLRAALQELLATPRESAYGGRELVNHWSGRWEGLTLRLDSVALRAGVATIRFSGDLPVAGVCDIPRITSQIEQTARQFPTVRQVRVFVNGTPLQEAIR